MENKCVVISGMHRSGTSLLASYLKLCGLDIGKNLLGPQHDNTKGYFEDADFVNLHKEILKRNKHNMFYGDKIVCNRSEINKISDLINTKQKKELWGWKDPRNVLFLDYYKNLIKNAKFIFIFRQPYSVIDSLIKRRSDKIININPFVAAKSWLEYNNKILKFYHSAKDISIIFELESLINNSQNIIGVMNKKFSLNLNRSNIRKIFDSRMLTKSLSNNFKNRIVRLLYKKRLSYCYNELKKIENEEIKHFAN